VVKVVEFQNTSFYFRQITKLRNKYYRPSLVNKPLHVFESNYYNITILEEEYRKRLSPPVTPAPSTIYLQNLCKLLIIDKQRS